MSNAQAPGWVSNRYPRVTAWVRLGDIAEINPQSLGEATPPNFEFEYIDLGSVDEGRIALPLQRTRFECAPSRARRLVRRGDVLIATVRPLLGGHARLQSVGASPTVASTGFAAIRAKNDEGAGLVWHCLRTNLVRRQFHAKVTGSSYPAVSEADIGELWLPKPSTAALRKVLAAADALDLAIEKTDALIAAKREQKRGLMQQLLTGKVRFPGFTEPWKTVRLGELGLIKSGGTPATGESAYWGGPHAWCTPTDVTALQTRHLSRTSRTITDAGMRASAAELLPPKSVIVCTRATVGIAAINTVPMSMNQGFKAIVPRRDVDGDFLYYAISHAKTDLLRRAAGSTFIEVSMTSFKDIPIRWPSSFAEQRRIATLLAGVDLEIELLSSQRAAFALQRRGLMERLLSGDISIPSSDTSAA